MFGALLLRMDFNVQFLENQQDFDRVMESLAKVDWIGFDTEFVGEKTFVPVLCLIQVVYERDIYLIDTLRITDLRAFLALLSNPDILKITHAGDNDYRLLNTLYDTVPLNTFDTQIAAGFVGYNYPAGFGKIVERELKITLAKSHTVANWEARPIDPKALKYAVEDVQYLPGLHQRLTNKLQKRGRVSWSREENQKWELPGFYHVDPFKEALANDFIHQLEYRDKVFLIRLYAWRRQKASDLNVPKETVLQSRHISTVVRMAKDGANALRANRTLPENVWRKYVNEWEELLIGIANPEEEAFLKALPKPSNDDPEHEWSMELMYHFIKKQCIEHEISAALLFPKGDFNKLKNGNADFDHALLQGWRAALLGEPLVQWLSKTGLFTIEWGNGQCVIRQK